MVIALFFVAHWHLSVFCQTFFLHRYGAHSMFQMSKGWEKFFYLMTYVTQGPSFLHPRAYAILHRMHHAYSDTERDPHSPENHSNVMSMMLETKKQYDGFAYGKVEADPRFGYSAPSWPLINKMGQSWILRFAWMGLYTFIYVRFATATWMFALLPVHFLMGPIHGAIVNWSGHRYGYRNFNTADVSRNSIPLEFICWGELFQNNHHRFGTSPKFSVRRFELDPAWYVMKALAKLRIIELDVKTAKVQWPDPEETNKGASTDAPLASPQ